MMNVEKLVQEIEKEASNWEADATVAAFHEAISIIRRAQEPPTTNAAGRMVEIMIEMEWHPEGDRHDWMACAKNGRPIDDRWLFEDRTRTPTLQRFWPDPASAILEARKWYRANVEKMPPDETPADRPSAASLIAELEALAAKWDSESVTAWADGTLRECLIELRELIARHQPKGGDTKP